jgi:hypothetical protein
MIQFLYENDTNTTLEEKEIAKNTFIDKLGTFKEEFEEKLGTAIINFDKPLDDDFRYTFSFPNHSSGDFAKRWNEEYINLLP